MARLRPERRVGKLDDVLVWEWAAFWPELVAGLITFSLGVWLAFRLLRRELELGAKGKFEEFQMIARQVSDDLEHAEEALPSWNADMERGSMIGDVDPAPLTWDIVEGPLRSRFVEHKVHVSTQLAISWFRRAEKLAREWNGEVSAGKLSEVTRRTAVSHMPAALQRVRQGKKELDEAAKLAPSNSRQLYELR